MLRSRNHQSSANSGWIVKKLIAGRLCLMGFLSIIIIVLEILEESVSTSLRIYVETTSIALFLALLAMNWILLEYPAKAKDHAFIILQMRHSLGVQLTKTTEWGKLVDLLLQFPHSITPLVGTLLLLYDPQSARFEKIAEQWSEDAALPADCAFQIPESCRSNLRERPGIIYPVELPAPAEGTHQPLVTNVYCLPLTSGETPIAQLLLYLPQEHTLSVKQCDMFNHVAPDLAIALSSALWQQEQTTSLIDKARDAERLGISRDLHDTLGQNLVYLRLKLDHLARDIDKADRMEMRAQLQEMRGVANRSYELVRGTLSILHAEEATPLINLLLDHSRLVVDRSKFKVRINQTGQPRKLEPALLRQIFYIFGEALSNVERHAGARNVTVKLAWGQQDLSIKISDNGRGFDPATIENRQHFGLAIMSERTAALGGRFDLRSTSRGTQLTFSFPLVSG